RRHIRTDRAVAGQHLLESRTALYRSASCRASVVRGKVAYSDYAFINGDADELFFVYAGKGSLVTLFGRLAFDANDYVLIPRGVPYYFDVAGDFEAFLIEGDPMVEIPPDFRNPH